MAHSKYHPPGIKVVRLGAEDVRSPTAFTDPDIFQELT